MSLSDDEATLNTIKAIASRAMAHYPDISIRRVALQEATTDTAAFVIYCRHEADNFGLVIEIGRTFIDHAPDTVIAIIRRRVDHLLLAKPAFLAEQEDEARRYE